MIVMGISLTAVMDYYMLQLLSSLTWHGIIFAVCDSR